MCLLKINFKKVKIFDLSYFRGKSHFEEDGPQNYLVFQPINRYFKIITNTKYFSSWQSSGLFDKTVWPPPTYTKSCNSLMIMLVTK